MKTLLCTAAFALLAQSALAAPATHSATGASVTAPATASRMSGSTKAGAPHEAVAYRDQTGTGWTAWAEEKQHHPEVDCKSPRSTDERKACESVSK